MNFFKILIILVFVFHIQHLLMLIIMVRSRLEKAKEVIKDLENNRWTMKKFL